MTAARKQSCRFNHLNHKCALSGVDFILCADAGKDSVHEANFRLISGNKAADLSHENEQGRLPDVGAFARHVGAGEDDESVALGFERLMVKTAFEPSVTQ